VISENALDELGLASDADAVLEKHDTVPDDVDPELVVVCPGCGPLTSHESSAEGQAVGMAQAHADPRASGEQPCVGAAGSVEVRERVAGEFVETIEEVGDGAWMSCL
jgi:hypothetical protein